MTSIEAINKVDLQRFEAELAGVKGWPDLERILGRLTQHMGLDFYALTWRGRPISPSAPEPPMVVQQNYPPSWVSKWREWNRRGRLDPVMLAAQRTSIPFKWAELEQSEELHFDAAEFMRASRDYGLGDGLTVPLHTADGASGACHFAVRPERTLPKENNLIVVGLLACNAAHRLSTPAFSPNALRTTPRLTPRQIECTVLAAQGLTEVAIAQKLNISNETVKRHLKQARQTYSVSKTIQLVTRCLHDESITFDAVVNDRFAA